MRDCFSTSAFMSASLEYLSRERIAGSFGLGLAEGSKDEAPGMSIAGNKTEVFKVGMPRLGSVRTRRIIAVPAKGLRSWTPCTYCFQKSPSGRLPVSSNLLISVDAERRIAPSRTRCATTRDETDRQVCTRLRSPFKNTERSFTRYYEWRNDSPGRAHPSLEASRGPQPGIKGLGCALPGLSSDTLTKLS